MNFWDMFGWFFGTFVFITYLIVLISIFVDLFRDGSLSGWAKAVWVFFLIFVPFLTGLVYLIARGKGMSERSAGGRTGGPGPGRVGTTADAYDYGVTGAGPRS